MWSFNFTLPTAVILSLYFFFFVSKRRLPVRMNHIFLGILGISMLTLIMDSLSTVMDVNYQKYDPAVLYAANLCFFFLFLLRAFSFLLFTVSLFEFSKREYPHTRHFLIGLFCFFCAGLILNAWTGMIFTINDHGYVAGSLYQLVNLSFAITIALTFYYIIQAHKTENLRKTGAYLFNTFLMVGILCRFLFPKVIVMNMFSLFALIVIFYYYTNPMIYIDQITKLFNLYGFEKVTGETSPRKKAYIVGFSIRSFNEFHDIYGEANIHNVFAQLGRYLHEEFPNLAGFYLSNGLFVLYSNKPFDEDAAIEEINERFFEGWVVNDNMVYLEVGFVKPQPGGISQPEILQGALRKILREAGNILAPQILGLDEEAVDEYNHYLTVQKVLQDAVKNRKVVMYLQPIVSSTDGSLAGAEALARIFDQEGNMISPGEFIPLAQKDGSISALGFWMFQQACKFLYDPKINTEKLGFINVNLAPVQCLNNNMASVFLEILESYQLLGTDKIRLEVTEETLIDPAILRRQMQMLQSQGMKFVLDDFGSAYSNLLRLKNNEFISIKFDKDVIWEHFKHPDTILEHIFEACRDLGITVTAEGVETREMAEQLRQMGCQYLQGFYFSKPLPVDEFIKKYL